VKYTVLKSISPQEYRVQVNDLLSITISSLNTESNDLFNFPVLTPIMTTNIPGGSGSANRTQPLGYLVDKNGKIELPLIGKITVLNLKKDEIGQLVKEEVAKIVKEPTVTVRLLNQKFTILGEVNRPGSYNIVNDNITLPEALGIAGDLTIFGKRTNVMLLRTQDDNREIVRIDLTSRSLLESPYYYIQNNDILYVEATQGKVTSSDRTLQMIPLITGVATSFVLLLNFLFK
jgi:polysaccharide export outer membrane protein